MRKTKQTVRFVFLILLAGCAAPASPAPELPPPGPSRGEQVLDLLEARAREVLGAIPHVKDRAAWEREKPRLQKRLSESLGLGRLPAPAAANLRVVGTIPRDGYRIEKLVYETLPGIEVPAHLYLPDAGGRKCPAILFVPGHWWPDAKTKTDFQAFGITMAKRGFVVLTYDPFGQGERGISLRDHRRTELLAVGVAQQAIVDYESMCAIGILTGRPEVDAARIGMTGASGGGFNSWIVPSLDARIAVTVPVVGTSEFYEQLSAVRERDWYDAKEHCHFVPGLLRYANNHEFVAMVAPRPLMFIAAHNDHSFRIPGNRAVADYAKQLYGALGESDKVAYVEDETEGHGYQKKKREAAYGWFLKWLKNEGDGSPAAEPPIEIPPWDAPELRCFPPGENKPAGPGLVGVARVLSSLASPKVDPAKLPEQLAQTLGISLQPRLTSSSKLRLDGLRASWTGRDGLEIPGYLLRPKGPVTGALLAAADEGKESLVGNLDIHQALATGKIVLLADVRGVGELAANKPGWIFAVSLLLGENFVGRQAMDLVGGWRALYALPELQGKPVSIYGHGGYLSLAALYAGVLEPRVAGVTTDSGVASYRDFVYRGTSAASYRLAKPGEEKTIKLDFEIPSALIPFDVLRRFDLPDLRAFPRSGALSGPLTIRNTNPSTLVDPGKMPARVHVAENYETAIEQRWWMAGMLENGAARGTLANDFDDRQGDPSKLYTAVIFNPVPGPPMGKNTRLKFRYWLKGTDLLRVQLYSLSNGYHRHLTLSGLPQGEWRDGCVDMTAMRRPDGTGGPLSDGERIDDIQFYTDAAAELMIDDIVLYDAAAPGESEPFPSRIVWTGGFDTGQQGKEWPGDFEIVPHEKPETWKFARSIDGKLNVLLRGTRPLAPGPLQLRFRSRLSEGDHFEVSVGGAWARVDAKPGDWAEQRLTIADPPKEISDIRFRLAGPGLLSVDDLLLYQP